VEQGALVHIQVVLVAQARQLQHQALELLVAVVEALLALTVMVVQAALVSLGRLLLAVAVAVTEAALLVQQAYQT
jgi:hypothetical protein